MLPRLCFTQTNPFAVGHRNEIKIGHLRRACRTRTAIVTAAEGTGQLHRAPPASPHRQDGTADRSPSQGLSVLPRWTLPWLSSAEQRHFSRAGRAAARRCAQGTAPAGAFAPSRQRPGAAESTALPTRGRSHRGSPLPTGISPCQARRQPLPRSPSRPAGAAPRRSALPGRAAPARSRHGAGRGLRLLRSHERRFSAVVPALRGRQPPPARALHGRAVPRPAGSSLLPRPLPAGQGGRDSPSQQPPGGEGGGGRVL